MHLGAINPGFVAQYAVETHPPAGSDWAKVLAAWNGSYTDPISVPSLGIYSYLPTVIALETMGYFNEGDNLSAGSTPPYPGPVALAQLATLDKDMKSADIWTPDANGKLQMRQVQPSSQVLLELTQVFFLVVASIITFGAAAAAGGAVVEGGTEGGVVAADGALDATGSVDGTALLDDAPSLTNAASFNDAANELVLQDGTVVNTGGQAANELTVGDIGDAATSVPTSGGGEGEAPSGSEEDAPGAQSDGNTPSSTSTPEPGESPEAPLNTDISVPESTSGLPTDISPQNLVKGLSTLLKIIGGGKVAGTGQGTNVTSNDSDYGQSGVTASGSVGGLFIIGLAAYLLYRER